MYKCNVKEYVTSAQARPQLIEQKQKKKSIECADGLSKPWKYHYIRN